MKNFVGAVTNAGNGILIAFCLLLAGCSVNSDEAVLGAYKYDDGGLIHVIDLLPDGSYRHLICSDGIEAASHEGTWRFQRRDEGARIEFSNYLRAVDQIERAHQRTGMFVTSEVNWLPIVGIGISAPFDENGWYLPSRTAECG